jgi:hypothetical protein
MNQHEDVNHIIAQYEVDAFIAFLVFNFKLVLIYDAGSNIPIAWCPDERVM